MILLAEMTQRQQQRRKYKASVPSRSRGGTTGWWKPIKREWQQWYAAKGPVLIFVLKFGFLILCFYGLLATNVCDRALYTYLQANAWISNIILNWSGHQTQVSDITIRSPLFAMALRRGCDAVEPTFLLCSAMLAFQGQSVLNCLGCYLVPAYFSC